MRARAIREGSVGLLILISVGLFGGLVLWLRGISPGRRTYQVGFVFENTLGMQSGTAVRYRGVPVGRVLTISPGANEVTVVAEITVPNLTIPKAVVARATQSGLIGDTTIDITPLEVLPEVSQALSPYGEDCNPQVIVCDGDILPGQVGASYEALLRAAENLAVAYSDPVLVAELRSTLNNASVAAAKAGVVADELTVLTQSVQAEVEPLSASARRAADSVGTAASQFELTGAEVNRLLIANQSNLNQTLNNVNISSQRLLTIMTDLEPRVRDSQFIANLDALSANAVLATASLRDITGAFGTQDNLIVLQQTIDSARNVFQSAQKVLADVDELTGDPAFRVNLRNLINGLSNLVSSTGTLEQQVQLAQMLTPVAGQDSATLTLTALPKMTATQAAAVPGPLLMAGNGQYYRVEFAQPGVTRPTAPAPSPARP